MTPKATDLPAVSDAIWRRKYRFAGSSEAPADQTLQDTFRRVANAAAATEKGGKRARNKWANAFYDSMADFGFQPAGRIIAGAGTHRNVTLFNCFVLGKIEDDLSSIFESVQEAALTMQAGGGIGHDFSTLRPRGAAVKSIGADASGPVSFMDVWDAMCRTIMSAGQRRGAMMATMRCDHPDIEDFVSAKSDPSRLRNFNLSVLVTDAFMDAVNRGAAWELTFEGQVYKTIDTRALWDKIMRATYDYAEPGVIFIDRVNEKNNLAYCETISATNPCGEQPLPPYGACLLGSINLARLVEKPFAGDSHIDIAKLEERVAIAVRFLDNVIDISRYPLEAQKREAHAKRRIGLGVTGLADALIFLGLTYGSAKARETAAHWLSRIQNAAYRASADLAAEKGAFPLYDADAFLSGANFARLDNDVQDVVRANGIRNGCLTSIAPTGTISLLAGNVSSGVEPVFDFVYRRRVLDDRQTAEQQTVEDYAHRMFREIFGDAAVLPDAFVTAEDLTPADHVAMQAALQPFVDSAISKTVNCPEGISFESFRDIYKQAFDLGLKGCTTYRPNPVTGAVLTRDTAPVQSAESPVPAVADVRKASIQPVAAEASAAGVVYMTKPLERDAALDGVTYKIKWPASAHALYVTINDIVRDGRRRPFEVFINTKNLEHYAWTVALTRMISAVFRRGGDVAFVAEELKAVFDPEGGRWMDGRYVPSLLAAIGDVIEKHMLRTGFLTRGGEADEAKPDSLKLLATVTPNAGASRPPHDGRIESETPHTAPITGARVCPRCGDRALRRIEGCWTCASCTYSRCG